MGARAAAAQALTQALEEADRPGEAPNVIWMGASPGCEEAVLQGIRDVLGNASLVLGGTAGDNAGTAAWSVFTRRGSGTASVAISVLYSDRRSASSFQNGYLPTALRGRITEAEGRVLKRIDGRPAAEVYNEWSKGAITSQLKGGVVVPLTALTPIGRLAGTVESVAHYKLSHLDAVTESGGLSLYTEVAAGEDVWLMEGSSQSLLSRASRVTEAAMDFQGMPPDRVLGAVVVYCAGCLRAVENDIGQVVGQMNQTLQGKPFLLGFTYGEQGCVVGRETVHGNLMVSSLVFGQ